MSRPLPPLAVPVLPNPTPAIDRKVSKRLWTAAELLDHASAVPEWLRIQFNKFLAGQPATKRKARDFLASLPLEKVHAP